MIRRSLKKSEFICRRNRIKRIRFAKTYMNWTADDWKKVIFSDESQFVIEDPKRIKLWKKSGEKYNYHQHYTTSTQKSLRVMVWGCITGDGIGSLTPVKGTINSQKYVSVLESNVIPVISEKYNWQSFLIMEDNAPPHTAANTQKYLEDSRVPKIDWPPQSPDLNPIENVWLRMKKEITKRKKAYKSVDDIMATVKHVWDSLPSETISSLYKSMPDRLKEVIKMKGHRTKF